MQQYDYLLDTYSRFQALHSFVFTILHLASVRCIIDAYKSIEFVLLPIAYLGNFINILCLLFRYINIILGWILLYC